MRTKPFTTEELFNTIVENFDNKELFEILDYQLATSKPVNITDYHFDIVGDLTYGSSEGIYLSMFLKGYITKQREFERVHIGTFKTLRTDRAAMREMATLMADFIYLGTDFVNDNIDDFDFFVAK